MFCDTINESHCHRLFTKQVPNERTHMNQPIQHTNVTDRQITVTTIQIGIILGIAYLFFKCVKIWLIKYRLQYLLRICFTIFICSFGTLLISYFLPIEDVPIITLFCSANTVFLLFIFSVMMIILRYHWGLPINAVMDSKSVGFSHLERIAKHRNTTVRKLSTEFLKHRDPGQLNPVYVNGWIPLIESTSVLRKQTATVVAIGNKFCIYRGEDGHVRVLDAYCPHMGADLSAGGRVIGNQIECPFHGWRFCGKTGKCTDIPYSDKVPEIIKAKVWESCECNGTIFVWHHAEGDPPSWELPWIPQIQNGQWIYRGRSELTVHCHIQEIPENGADINHLSQIHSRLFFLGPSLVSGIGNLLSHDWQPQWSPDEEQSHVARVNIKQQVLLMGDFKIPWSHVDVKIEQIGPAAVHLHMQTAFGSGVMLQYITSEGPMQQRIVHTFYTEPGFKHFPATVLIWGETIMIQRDIAVWNNKKFLRNPMLVKEDKLISKFRRWYSQFYSEHSPTLQDVRQMTLEW